MGKKKTYFYDERLNTLCILDYGKGEKYGFVHRDEETPVKLYKAKKTQTIAEVAEEDCDEYFFDKKMKFDLTKGLGKLHNFKSNFDMEERPINVLKIFSPRGMAGEYLDALHLYQMDNPARSTLAVHMLSGQIYRGLKKIDETNTILRPILHIDMKSDAKIRDFMKESANRFCRDWTGKNDYMEFSLPMLLPTSTMVNDLDAGYIIDKDAEEHRKALKCPAYYTDTTVVIDTRRVDSKKINHFADANPDCVLVLCGKAPKSLAEHVCATIKFADLDIGNTVWLTNDNKETLREMTYFFGNSLLVSDLKDAARWGQEQMEGYAETHPILTSIDRSTKLLYLTTAKLLTDWLADRDFDEKCGNQIELLRSQLYNLVLPGYYTPMFEEDSTEPVLLGSVPLTEQNFEDAAKQTISRMLEDLSRYRFVSQGEACPPEDELEKKGIDGFLRMFDIDKAHKTQVPSVLFYKKTFVRLFKEKCPYRCEDEKLLDKLLSAFSKGKLMGCCPERDVSKDRFSEKSPRASVRLLVGNLDFLPEGKMEELKQAFQDKE